MLTKAVAADTELAWEPPGPGTWQHDPSHAPGAPTRLFARFNCDAMAEGMATVMKQFGGPMAGMEVKFVHGKYYRRLVPLVGADRDMPPPPAFLVWVLSRVHPKFRRRNKRALAAFAGQEWRPELERWERELRPAWLARDLALQDEDIASMDDAALADHVRRVFDAAYEGHVLHFALHGVDLGPIGDLLAHTDRWGIPDLDVVATLEGASPASAAAAVHLDRLGALVRASGQRPASLDDVRSISPEASAALDDYLREFGSRIVTGYDVDCRTLAELPEAVLASIRAAADGPPQDPEAARARADAAADGVRARLSDADRATFDELLDAARRVYGLRDDNGPLTAEWPIGLLRRGLLEAGRRLVERGALVDATHTLELDLDEVGALLGGGSTPTAEDVAERATTRASQALLEPPMVLGRETPPPPTSVLPAGLRRATEAILRAVAVIEPPEGERKPLCGTGIGREPYTGRARVAARPEDALAAIEPGDVLVATFTTPAYNTVLTVAGAVVVEEGGALCHAAVMARRARHPRGRRGRRRDDEDPRRGDGGGRPDRRRGAGALVADALEVAAVAQRWLLAGHPVEPQVHEASGLRHLELDLHGERLALGRREHARVRLTQHGRHLCMGVRRDEHETPRGPGQHCVLEVVHAVLSRQHLVLHADAGRPG